MATTLHTAYEARVDTTDRIDVRIRSVARPLMALGRVMFGLIFILSVLSHFSDGTIAYASQAGVPMAGFLVPASGVIAFLGGLMIALGWHARIGATLLLIFLLPVTLTMHDFWTVSDPMERMNQQAHFMKNLALIGGAIAIAYFGSGPSSVDAREIEP
ncbi:MAG: DoxX family protein [Bdellovibrionaceae bacterium]|nr:DoxX family protein [Pseudobdellovibrionaceae bacterium]